MGCPAVRWRPRSPPHPPRRWPRWCHPSAARLPRRAGRRAGCAPRHPRRASSAAGPGPSSPDHSHPPGGRRRSYWRRRYVRAVEKVIITMRRDAADDAWCDEDSHRHRRGPSRLDLPGVAVNVRDAAVRDSLMTLTTLDPPVVALVSLWTQQCYGAQVRAALALLEMECDDVAAYLVTESVPLPAPATAPGERTDGFANVALLRRPAGHGRRDLVRPLASRSHPGRDRHTVDVRLHAERGRAGAHPRRTGARRDRGGAVPDRGDRGPARVLRRRRRRRPRRPDEQDGGEHVGIRRQPERRHRAHQSLRVPVTIRRGGHR